MFRFVENSSEALDQASSSPALETDPTPEQIAIRTAAIRAGWTDRQRHRRRVPTMTIPLPPLVKLDDWVANVAAARRN